MERGTSGEEEDGVADDGIIRGVDAGDVARKNEQGDAHAEHEACTKNDRSVTSETSGGGFSASDGLSDADGSGRGDAEGNHVGEGDGVEGDLVGGERDGAEARDERSDCGEDGDFGGELQGSGKSKGNELADTLKIGLNGRFEQLCFVARVVPEEIADQDRSEIGARDRSGPSRAGDTERRESEFAEDEEIVSEKIDEIGSDEGKGDGTNHVHALEGATNGEIEKQGKEAGRKCAHVRSGKHGDAVSYPEAFEIERDEPDREGEQRSDGETEVDTVDERAMAIFAMASAEGL